MDDIFKGMNTQLPNVDDVEKPPLKPNNRPLKKRPRVRLDEDRGDALDKANVILKALREHADYRFYVNEDTNGIVQINGRDVIAMDHVTKFQHRIQQEMVLYYPVEEGEKLWNVPPKDAVQSLIEREEWPYLRKLKRIARFPIFVGEDFELFDREGYDPASGTYGMEGMLKVKDMTLEEAKDILINKLLRDDGGPGLDPEDPPGFPFVDESDLANAIGMALTPLVLPAIRDRNDNACVPVFMIDASTQGTGKTILAESLLTPELRNVSIPKTEEEFQKALGSIIGTKRDVLFFDNILDGATFGYPTLAAMTTQAGRASMRRLGVNQMIEGRFSGIIIATGNNLQVDADARRRTMLIQLHSSLENPDQRVCKTDPKSYAKKNRSLIHSALIELVKNWKVKGCPSGSIVMGSFGEFTRVVGGILDAAGIPGFAGNTDRLRERVDDGGWTDFTAAIGAEFEAKRLDLEGVTARNLVKYCEENDIDLPARLASGNGADRSFGRQVKQYIRGPKNMGGWMWEFIGSPASKRSAYRVRRYQAPLAREED
ncbi:hypothetical protein FRD01_02570 [Microvenator marinus]|uniref:Uncharacterized protein n=1 Tax=Microvenator marinus TaxID=2600177 RepID=A0A5B8XK45_9DELT|nr:hypothetical protein [Microvenator marinus]QED26160.1 hypothetical protein FRD01_02570 [Microvenator marinus]